MDDRGDDPLGRSGVGGRAARAAWRGLRARWPQVRMSLLLIAFVCSCTKHETLATGARVLVWMGDVAWSRSKR